MRLYNLYMGGGLALLSSKKTNEKNEIAHMITIHYPTQVPIIPRT